jgi:hypothetical protein
MVKLTYRGHTYESTSNSVQIDAKPVILNYRGVKFEYQPKSSPVPLSCDLPQDGRKAVKLTYRGQTFDIMPPAPQPYRKPRAMNWRLEMIAQYHGVTA